MPVVAILNRKGGSGKSTLATNIAGWCASQGWRVMLGDVDRQQSVKSWLARRSPDAAPVVTWAVDNGKVFRAPPGTTHVVLDTPGALYDHDLAKLLVWVDAVIVPIGPSVFDRDASLSFLEDIRKHPKVKSGRCQLVAIGMRWPHDAAHHWRDGNHVWDTHLLTVIADHPQYRRNLETGTSVFDQPGMLNDSQAMAWQPLTQWLHTVWHQASPDLVQGGRPAQRSARVKEAHPVPRPQASTPSISRQEPAGVESRRSATPIPAYLLKTRDDFADGSGARHAHSPPHASAQSGSGVGGATAQGLAAGRPARAAGGDAHQPAAAAAAEPPPSVPAQSWLRRLFA